MCIYKVFNRNTGGVQEKQYGEYTVVNVLLFGEVIKMAVSYLFLSLYEVRFRRFQGDGDDQGVQVI